MDNEQPQALTSWEWRQLELGRLVAEYAEARKRLIEFLGQQDSSWREALSALRNAD